jgi:hypothetical protein
VRNRTGGGCAAKRAVRELDVTRRVVVRMLRGQLRGNGLRADLEQKRRTAGRHEANGHVSTKQEDDQQPAGHQVAPAMFERALPHVLWASDLGPPAVYSALRQMWKR